MPDARVAFRHRGNYTVLALLCLKSPLRASSGSSLTFWNLPNAPAVTVQGHANVEGDWDIAITNEDRELLRPV